MSEYRGPLSSTNTTANLVSQGSTGSINIEELMSTVKANSSDVFSDSSGQNATIQVNGQTLSISDILSQMGYSLSDIDLNNDGLAQFQELIDLAGSDKQLATRAEEINDNSSPLRSQFSKAETSPSLAMVPGSGINPLGTQQQQYATEQGTDTAHSKPSMSDQEARDKILGGRIYENPYNADAENAASMHISSQDSSTNELTPEERYMMSVILQQKQQEQYNGGISIPNIESSQSGGYRLSEQPPLPIPQMPPLVMPPLMSANFITTPDTQTMPK